MYALNVAYFDYRSKENRNANNLSISTYVPETRRPKYLGECIYCRNDTSACRMSGKCTSRDDLRFCGLPVGRIENGR